MADTENPVETPEEVLEEEQDPTLLSFREQSILALLIKPNTLYKMARQLNVHEMTVRRDVHHLIELDLVKEYPMKDGKKKQYVRSEIHPELNVDEHGNLLVDLQPQVNFIFQGQSADLYSLVSSFSSSQKPGYLLIRAAGALAHLVGRAHWAKEGMPDKINEPDLSGVTTEIYNAYIYFKEMASLFNQLLTSVFLHEDGEDYLAHVNFDAPMQQIDTLYTRLANGAMGLEDYRNVFLSASSSSSQD